MGKAKILIVDDEQVVLDSCRKILAAEGYEVFLASSAVEALAAMKTDEFSLLIIDIKMPAENIFCPTLPFCREEKAFEAYSLSHVRLLRIVRCLPRYYPLQR